VVYRGLGASKAAESGAVAALVRSITPLAMQIPHTGMMRYADGPPEIPTAAISIEDAMMLARLVDEGLPVKVHLEMGAHLEPDADSANVIGEIAGREMPDEIVAVGGHIDSWDVGQGAQDDGVGIMASLEAVALIHKLGLKPRRTIRVVFWVNEENGQRGSKAYRDWLGSSVNRHVAAIEMDGGAETPRGFGFGTEKGGDPQSVATLKEIGKLLDRVGAGAILPNGKDTDIEPLIEAGVPGLAERTVGTHYFDWHHTEADTLDKVNPEDFRKNVAALAVMTYVLADMPQRLKP
jgi:Zn-dependent M28 family amino/carboxypeptidase